MNATPTVLATQDFGTSATLSEPNGTLYASGYLPNQLLPAEQFNWLMNRLTHNGVLINSSTVSISNELTTILTAASITPSSGSTTQVKSALDVLYAAKGGAQGTAVLNGVTYTAVQTAIFGGTSQIQGGFDKGSTNPSHTDRLNYDGALWAMSFTSPSTKVIKENIKDFKETALDIIKATKVVSYTLINDTEHEECIGFIAEDTPAVLSGKDHNSVKVGNVLGVLIKAVQELSDRLDSMEARL